MRRYECEYERAHGIGIYPHRSDVGPGGQWPVVVGVMGGRGEADQACWLRTEGVGAAG